jgi:hypothetical protein
MAVLYTPARSRQRMRQWKAPSHRKIEAPRSGHSRLGLAAASPGGSPGAEAAAEVGPGPGPGVWPWPEVGMKVAARLGGTPARAERGGAALGAASSMAGRGEPDVWRARARGGSA